MNQALEYIDTDLSRVSINLIIEIDTSNYLYKIHKKPWKFIE